VQVLWVIGYTGTLSCFGTCTFVTSGCVPQQTSATILLHLQLIQRKSWRIGWCRYFMSKLANAAGLSGTWMAWMSSLSVSASSRLTHSNF